MVLAKTKLDQAVLALRRMGAKRVVLFGSYATNPDTASDVDLAVEGIPLCRLLDADMEVHSMLSAPTDLVSREENPTLYDVVVRYGKVLYEQ